MIGLLTYYQYTGNADALNASRKAADLLIATFPAKKSILEAGTHVGMAATSVLEPVVLLYRLTGEERYLAFAHYIVKSWDEPKGPGILQTLLTEKQVNKVANGKAYEMLSNIVGLCDLARATGDKTLIEASLIAWQDVVDHRLYLTGSFAGILAAVLAEGGAWADALRRANVGAALSTLQPGAQAAMPRRDHVQAAIAR